MDTVGHLEDHDDATPASPTPPTPGSTMRAIVHRSYGDAEVLHLDDVPVPTIRPDEVLVAVGAAGLDRGTWHVMTGQPYLLRLAYGLRRPRQPVPGLDVAGRVAAVGSEVTRLSPGDEVFGMARGSFAPFAAALESKLTLKPPELSYEQAAAVPVSGLTALQALRDAAPTSPGDRVLIVGASGGVGSYAVQIARAFGANVTAVCSTGKLDLVRSLGADEVIDYTDVDVTEGDARFDIIVDIGGSTPLRRFRRILAPTGTVALVGGEEGGRLTGVVPRLLAAGVASLRRGQRFVPVISKERYEDVQVLADLVSDGRVTPALDRVYPLADAAEAMRRLETGQVRGKVALRVGER